MCKTLSVLEFPNILHLSFPWHLNPIVIQVFIASKIHSEILAAESEKPTSKGGWVSHCGALVFLYSRVCLMELYQNQPVVETDGVSQIGRKPAATHCIYPFGASNHPRSAVSEKLTVCTLKMGAPWKRRFRIWKPSFLASMLVLGI